LLGHRFRGPDDSLSCSRLYLGEKPPPPAACDLLVVMGGPMSVWDEARHPWLREEKRYLAEAVAHGIRILGVCLGAQLLAEVLGARVFPGSHKEIGWFRVRTLPEAKPALPTGFPGEFTAFHWHGDTFAIPGGATHLFASAGCPGQGFLHEDRFLGLQFHLESTRDGVRRLVANCATDLADGGQYVQSREEILSREPGEDSMSVLGAILQTIGIEPPGGAHDSGKSIQ
jgi:GMP synthase-like glutamine amidotransferase